MKSLNNQFLLNHYQARKGQTLVAHLRECAETASCLLNQIGLSRMGQVLGWCHDVGKLSDAFASYLEETSRNSDKVSKLRGTVDHSTAGAQLVWRKMNLQAKESLSSGLILRQMLALCIASHHHDSLLDCWRGRFSDDAILCNRLNKEDQDSHYEEIIGKLTPENLEFYGNLLDAKQLIDEFKSIYSLLTESREGWKDAPFYFGMLTRLMLSVLISADYKSASGGGSLEQCVVPDWQTIQNKLEETYMEHFTSDSELNRCRNKMSTACFEAGKREQGIYTLTLPTGAGKTLASLRFAVEHARRHSLARIVYVIPYTTILDQTARVIRRALGEEWCRYNLVEHHSNFCPEYQGQNQDSWDPERKNWYMEACLTWDVPIVLTTSVQYLNACFTAGKQHVRRMNSLMNSVVIFDEVQAMRLLVRLPC